jgi:hypothetical protein
LLDRDSGGLGAAQDLGHLPDYDVTVDPFETRTVSIQISKKSAVRPVRVSFRGR